MNTEYQDYGFANAEDSHTRHEMHVHVRILSVRKTEVVIFVGSHI